MAKKVGIYQVPDHSAQLFDLYHILYQQSQGRITPLIGQMLSQLGYDSAYSFQTQTPDDIPQWGLLSNIKTPLFKSISLN